MSSRKLSRDLWLLIALVPNRGQCHIGGMGNV